MTVTVPGPGPSPSGTREDHCIQVDMIGAGISSLRPEIRVASLIRRRVGRGPARGPSHAGHGHGAQAGGRGGKDHQ